MDWALARRLMAFALVLVAAFVYLGSRFFDWQ
jgi:hypothetical protein